MGDRDYCLVLSLLACAFGEKLVIYAQLIFHESRSVRLANHDIKRAMLSVFSSIPSQTIKK